MQETNTAHLKTKGGTFMTEHMTKLKVNINELDQHKSMAWKCNVDDLGADTPCDMIVGIYLSK